MKSSPSSYAAVSSFYHLDQCDLTGRACHGLACFAARADNPQRWQQTLGGSPAIHCLGQCYAGPALGGPAPVCHVQVDSPETVLLANVVAGGITDLAGYQQRGGGQALRQVLSMSPATVIHELQLSGLRGRGGAGFPAWRKWQALVEAAAPCKYLVVNADEGDPGTFSDRLLLELDPFRLLEACVIAAVTLGIGQGYIYLRAEYPRAGQILQIALDSARREGWLGSNLLGSDHHFELSLVLGKGSYICGEETAMLNAMEGLRPEVRVRPPQPTTRGLHGAPTLVHNVETLCTLPWILQRGGAAYAALGCGTSRGTKLLSLNSLFCRPGLYEVEFGISLRRIVEELGGGLRRGQLKGVMLGGPLAGLIPPTLLDTPLDYEALQAVGGAVGHGGVIAFAEDTSIAQIIAEVFRFGANESCGKCTPCHLGSPELARMFSSVSAGEQVDMARWAALVAALAATSLCGHGRGLAEFARAIERHYPEELALCFQTS